MPDVCSFRQVDEKHVSAEVDLMEWSPKMDLIAVANIQGEVVLHRLSWQKVWTLAPPSEEVKVKAVAWRPDGKVLAVGYTSGHVRLCDVEKSDALHSLEIEGQVSSMTWVFETLSEQNENTTSTTCFEDNSAEFLPKLAPLQKSYGALSKGQSEECVEDAKSLKDQKGLNLLVVGSSLGDVHMYAYGVFPVGTLQEIGVHISGKAGKICTAAVSQDLQVLSLILETHSDTTDDTQMCLVSIDTTLLASRYKELQILALKFGHIPTLMAYLQSTIKQMSEAWEDILLEMDSKLLKFAEEKYKLASGTVSNDFLELLLFGIPSDELQTFLLHELTEKGLKKLGHSIETSYSNIQKLVLKHLQSVGQSILYHLSDLRGMSLWHDKFGILGLSTQSIDEAIALTGAFMIKAVELQQVIDSSMKNFKAFFRWLYVVILRLSDEQVPPELGKMTQQDLNFVAEFLKENFTEEMDGTRQGFKLERVGQYLKNEELQDPPDNTGNPWLQFQQSSAAIKDLPSLYAVDRKRSMVQVHEQLKTLIEDALAKPANTIGHSHMCSSVIPLFSVAPSEDEPLLAKYSQFTVQKDEESWLYTVFTSKPTPCEQCYIIRQRTKTNSGESRPEIVSVKFGAIGPEDLNGSAESERCRRHQILDVSSYDQQMLSFLLQEEQEDGMPVLVQVPLSAVSVDDFVPIPANHLSGISGLNIRDIDVGSSVDSMNYRRLENMRAVSFAVSGTRKVACVLFSSRRRVRLFLMDVEDEDDEDEDETVLDDSSAQDTSKLSDTKAEAEDEDKENTSHETSGMDL